MKFLASLVFLSLSGYLYSQDPAVQNIIYVYDVLHHSPKELSASEVRIQGVVPREQSYYILNEIYNGVGKYPSRMILSLVDRINIVATVIYRNTKNPGVVSGRTIYIATKNNTGLEKTFHHEFSQVLLGQHPAYLDSSSWMALSGNPAFPIVRKKMLFVFSKKIDPVILYENGYLNETGLLNWRSDFATYAENLFSGGKAFWKLIDQYPRIKQKALLAIGFYHQTYSVFTENWFRFISEYRLF